MTRFANADGAGKKMPLLLVIVIDESNSVVGPAVVLEDRDGRRAELSPAALTRTQGASADELVGTVPAHIFDRNLISGKQRGFWHYEAMAQTGQPHII